MPVVIDGAHGEGGGQILRTALALSALTGRPLRMERIRANRRNAGLAAQHLTAVRATASLCDAELRGDELASMELDFIPRRPVSAGSYTFDVASAREGGSAGSVSLVLQTVLVPLAFASGQSKILVRGGTHLPNSPSVDYLQRVWLPMLARLGIDATLTLDAWGWYPVGKGQIRATIGASPSELPARTIEPLELTNRGPLDRIHGRAVAANLPSHIPQRMADRASALLRGIGARIDIQAERVHAACPGAGIFLVAEYEHACAGFCAFGAIGKASEAVADEAVTLLLRHRDSGAALDRHMGDQILLPLCLAEGPSRYSVENASAHLQTNAWVIEQFGIASVMLESSASGTGLVTVTPISPEQQRPS